MTPTTTTQRTTYQPQRMPPIKPTAYTQGFNDGCEGHEYHNPFWGDLDRWLAYNAGHQDGRKGATAVAAARGGGR